MMNQENIEKYKTYLLEEEKSDATIEKYLRDVMAFGEWLSDQELTKRNVLCYKESLMKVYAPSSVNSILSSLNSFFEYNERPDLKVRMIKIQRQIFAEKNRELSKAEYQRLLKAAQKKKQEQLYYLMQTICTTGIRVSEVAAITVEAIRNRQAIIRCKGKTRIVLLPKDLCKLLMGYVKRKNIQSGPIFITKSGKALDRSTIWRMMKALCESAKVAKEKVFPHNLRHLFARTYYMAQKDIVRLADILGHSNVNTTRIYTMETSDVHRKQIQELGLLQMCNRDWW